MKREAKVIYRCASQGFKVKEGNKAKCGRFNSFTKLCGAHGNTKCPHKEEAGRLQFTGGVIQNRERNPNGTLK